MVTYVFLVHCLLEKAANYSTQLNDSNEPSKGEKAPFISSSRSHNCLSVKTMAGKFSASASSSACFDVSLASRSFRTPPWGEFAIAGLGNLCSTDSVYDKFFQRFKCKGNPLVLGFRVE